MRKAFTLVAKIAVSCLLLYFALHTVDLASVKARLDRIDGVWLAFGFVVLLMQTLLLALRWRLIVLGCGATLPVSLALRFCIIGIFFNQTLPSSVGGDAMRIWLLARHADWRAAAYSVFLDRVIGVFVLASLVLVCLPWTLQLVRNPVGRGALLAIGCGFVIAGAIFVGLAWERLHVLQRWAPTRHLAAVATIAANILRSPRVFVSVFGLSILIHLFTAFTAWCAARAVGADLPLLDALYLVLPVVLITVIPISIAGWGLREGAMVAAFAYAGLAQSDGLAVSLLFGAGYLALGILGGAVWIATAERRYRNAVVAADGEPT